MKILYTSCTMQNTRHCPTIFHRSIQTGSISSLSVFGKYPRNKTVRSERLHHPVPLDLLVHAHQLFQDIENPSKIYWNTNTI